MPAAILLGTMVGMHVINSSVFQPAFWFNFCVSLLLLLDYQYAEKNKKITGLSYKSKYRENKNKGDSGPMRLDQTCERFQDIYQLLMASQFKATLIDFHRWEAETQQKNTDEIVKNYQK